MVQYCTIEQVQLILPSEHLIGNNLSDENVTILSSDVIKWIEFASDLINSQINTIYRIPLIKYREPDFSSNPIVFIEKYPDPIPLICSRITAGHIYDEIIMANQEPNVSEWGKNQRSLGHDLLRDIQSGMTILINQPIINFRFVRGQLYDSPRVSRPGELQPTQRQSGT